MCVFIGVLVCWCIGVKLKCVMPKGKLKLVGEERSCKGKNCRVKLKTKLVLMCIKNYNNIINRYKLHKNCCQQKVSQENKTNSAERNLRQKRVLPICLRASIIFRTRKQKTLSPQIILLLLMPQIFHCPAFSLASLRLCASLPIHLQQRRFGDSPIALVPLNQRQFTCGNSRKLERS